MSDTEVPGYEGDDPRPVFEGDWQSASAADKGRHGQAVKAWLKRHPEAKLAATTALDAESAAAILGSGKPDAPLASLALRTLRRIAADTSAPASAQVTAANALHGYEREARDTAESAARAERTAALAAAPMPERLAMLERIVRIDDPEPWVSIFAGTTSEAAPSAPSAPPAEGAAG